VPGEYVPMMLEEMQLDREDRRSGDWDGVSNEARAGFRVIVIARACRACFAAIRLEEAGVPYVVIEKNDAVGGTWLENAYPGCRVGRREPLLQLLVRAEIPIVGVLREAGRAPRLLRALRERLRRARPRSACGPRSSRALRPGDITLESGCSRGGRSRGVLTGERVRQRSRSAEPPEAAPIPGVARFGGAAFHSSRWPQGLDLAGKRVAVTYGASAFRSFPKSRAREPPLRLPTVGAVDGADPRYHAPVTERRNGCCERAVLRSLVSLPALWPGSDGVDAVARRRSGLAASERSVNGNDDMMRAMYAVHGDQIGDDAGATREGDATYPPFVKRMLQDNGAGSAR